MFAVNLTRFVFILLFLQNSADVDRSSAKDKAEVK